MVADRSGRVCIGITRSLAKGWTIIVVVIPVNVEEGVDGVGFEGGGANGGDLKAATRGRSAWEFMRCRHCRPK